MSDAIRIHPEAGRELVAAIDWYDARGTGLGLGLEVAIDETLRRIATAPRGGTRWSPTSSLRWWRVRRFPFLIVYRTDPDLLVVAIAHTRRRPG